MNLKLNVSKLAYILSEDLTYVFEAKILEKDRFSGKKLWTDQGYVQTGSID